MVEVVIRARDDLRVGHSKVGRRLYCKVGVDSVTNQLYYKIYKVSERRPEEVNRNEK
jgi:hypothetical protein